MPSTLTPSTVSCASTAFLKLLCDSLTTFSNELISPTAVSPTTSPASFRSVELVPSMNPKLETMALAEIECIPPPVLSLLVRSNFLKDDMFARVSSIKSPPGSWSQRLNMRSVSQWTEFTEIISWIAWSRRIPSTANESASSLSTPEILNFFINLWTNKISRITANQ